MAARKPELGPAAEVEAATGALVGPALRDEDPKRDDFLVVMDPDEVADGTAATVLEGRVRPNRDDLGAAGALTVGATAEEAKGEQVSKLVR